MSKGEKLYKYLEEEAKEYLAIKGSDFFTPYDNDIIYREVIYNLRYKLDDEEFDNIIN